MFWKNEIYLELFLVLSRKLRPTRFEFTVEPALIVDDLRSVDSLRVNTLLSSLNARLSIKADTSSCNFSLLSNGSRCSIALFCFSRWDFAQAGHSRASGDGELWTFGLFEGVLLFPRASTSIVFLGLGDDNTCDCVDRRLADSESCFGENSVFPSFLGEKIPQ